MTKKFWSSDNKVCSFCGKINHHLWLTEPIQGQTSKTYPFSSRAKLKQNFQRELSQKRQVKTLRLWLPIPLIIKQVARNIDLFLQEGQSGFFQCTFCSVKGGGSPKSASSRQSSQKHSEAGPTGRKSNRHTATARKEVTEESIHLSVLIDFADEHVRVWPILQRIPCILRIIFPYIRRRFVRQSIISSPCKLLDLVIELLVYWANLCPI